jgi:hypothetical protein
VLKCFFSTNKFFEKPLLNSIPVLAHTRMASRHAVVAALIAGAALVAVAMVVTTPTTKPAPTLAEKLEMLKSYKGQPIREQHNMMLDALGAPAVNGRCPCAAGDCIFQDGMCYKARVCYLPTDIWCSKGLGQCGGDDTKQTCGSGADKSPCPVNYEKGWSLPQGCKATCMVSTDLLRGERKFLFPVRSPS